MSLKKIFAAPATSGPPPGYGETFTYLRISQRISRVAWIGTEFVIGGGGLDFPLYISSSNGTEWGVPKTRASLGFAAASNASINGIASSPSAIVIGASGGYVASSLDGGATFTQRTSGTTNALNRIVWSGSLFVAVGAAGTILSSPNGTTWTVRTSGTTQSLNAVVRGLGLFVAVGATGTILTSTDGINWVARSSGTTQPLTAIGFSGTTFVAVGTNNVILSSTDALTWTARTSAAAAGNALQSVDWGAGLFVVGGGSSIQTSPDGTTWTFRNNAFSVAVTGIAWSGSRFVAVSATLVLTSTNGIDWTQLNPARPNIEYIIMWDGTRFVATGSSGNNIAISTNGINWTFYPNTYPAMSSPRRLVWTGTQYILCGGTNFVLTSPDAITWTTRTLPMTANVASGAAASSSIIVLSIEGFGRFMTSPDGVTWTLRTTSSTTARWVDVLLFGSNFVAVSDAGLYGISSDGINWTVATTAVGNNLRSMATNGSIIVAIGANRCITSTNGTTWTARTLPGFSPFYDSVTWTGSLFVASPSNFNLGSSNFATSPDGITWTSRPVGGFEGLPSNTRSDARQAVAGNTNIIVSTAVSTVTPSMIFISPQTVPPQYPTIMAY